nr:hypothetical protein [Tanacetum cinerariifolium]
IVQEEPHGLDTSILDRVADRITSPAPVGTAIPRASREEITVTRPGRKVVTKADNATKQKASLGQIYLLMQPRRPDRVRMDLEQVLADSRLKMGSSRLMMVSLMMMISVMTHSLLWRASTMPAKEVEPDVERSRGVRRTARVGFRASHGISEDASPRAREGAPAFNAQPLDVDVDVNEIGSDGNFDLYYEARVGNTVGDILEIDLLPIVLRPYYIPYLYDEGSESESPPYTKDDWEEIHGVNLGMQKKELYKDPKAYRTALNRFPTPAKTYRLMAQLGVFKSRCQTAEHKLSSWDKKHRKYRSERDALPIEKENIKEELVETKSQLEHCERQAEEIQGCIASFFQSDFTPLVQRFVKSGDFNRAFAGVLNTAISSSLQDIARLEPGKVMPPYQTSYATSSLRANTHVRHSTSSSGTFGHTSTSGHLKKKKKSVENEVLRIIYALPASADVASGLGLLDQYGPVLSKQLLGCGKRART